MSNDAQPDHDDVIRAQLMHANRDIARLRELNPEVPSAIGQALMALSSAVEHLAERSGVDLGKE